MRACSSVGRALLWHRRGRRSESGRVHLKVEYSLDIYLYSLFIAFPVSFKTEAASQKLN
jgi:hypothetical protein